MCSHGMIDKMRMTYRALRKEAGYSKYTTQLPDFPNKETINSVSSIISFSPTFVCHNKEMGKISRLNHGSYA